MFEDLEPSLSNTKTIAVIGAGITGITAAYSLAKRGYAVEVIDQEPYAAMRTSYANGGQFSVSNADTWCTWSNVGKGLKWMLSKDAPLLVRPTPSMSKLWWLAQFLYNTANGTQQSNTKHTIQMALYARQLYEDIADREGIEFDHKRNGILHFYKDAHSLEAAKRMCDFYQSQGVDRYPVSAEHVKLIEPALGAAPGIIGGTFTPDDGMGDIHAFCANLANVLRDKYSVTFRYDTRVVDLYNIEENVILEMQHGQRTIASSYAQVVISAGADSSAFGHMLGDPVSVYPVKGYSITVPLDGPLTAPITSLLDDDAKIVTSTLGDRLRVAGTAELDGWNRDIRMDRIEPLLRWVRTNMPQIKTEHAVPWAGLRPMTPNMMPIVQRCGSNDRVWWNTGHGHLGWTLAPATADIIADLIGSEQTP